MKNSLLFSILAIVTFLMSCNTKNNKTNTENKQHIPSIKAVGVDALPHTIAPIDAPFNFKSITSNNFPDRVLSITSVGASTDTTSTTYIQKAIDQLHSQGGGTVIIPKGKWLSGRIELKSNINLHFEDGAELRFSGELKDYQPAVFTRIEGIEVMSLGACIYANNATNIAITGKGKLFGPQKGPVREYLYTQTVIEKVVPLDKPVNERKYSGINGEGYFLPMFIAPINCKNILIEGISLQNTAFWNIVPTYCENVTIRGVEVNSVGIERGDGIDIESSKNVLIEYCTLSSGDDCFTLKAGRGKDGLRINKPTENVLIRYCLAKEGHGGITCGSETAGTIRNVYVHDCVMENTGVGIRFKTRRPRGGGGNNFHYERIRMNLRYTAFKWDMLGSPGSVGEVANRLPQRTKIETTPEFKNIFAKDIVIENCTHFLKVIGIPESPLKNLNFKNINAKSDKLIYIADANDITIKDCKILCNSDSIELVNTKNLIISDVYFSNTEKQTVFISDSISATQITYNNCLPSKWATEIKN